MTFDEVIKGLYSENREVVLATLNAGCHLDSICDSDLFVVDTGFECKLHTNHLTVLLNNSYPRADSKLDDWLYLQQPCLVMQDIFV